LEDEKPAQGVLKKYIAELPYLELIAVHSNPLSAMEVLQSEHVDLIFLDINLPKISGLNFLKSLKDPPEIIITTAYSEYALEGFELNVTDYLLKPFSFERFLKAVSTLSSNSKKVSNQHRVEKTVENNGFTFEKVNNTIYKIVYNQIRYIESDRDYVRLFMDNEKYSFRQSLKYWEEMLPVQQFSRVHKSYILNVKKITQITGNRIIAGNDVIPIGRNYKEAFMEKINKLN
jgi:DNA-binding LytR/AlgR family response regulator